MAFPKEWDNPAYVKSVGSGRRNQSINSQMVLLPNFLYRYTIFALNTCKNIPNYLKLLRAIDVQSLFEV